MALLAALLVILGSPAWGSDVGGVLTGVPALDYVGYRLWGARIRFGTLVVLGLATLIVIGGFAAYDLAQPAEDRSHLGRLVEQVDAQGSDAFITVVMRKFFANLRVITSSVWLLMVPGALAFTAYLVWRRPILVRVIERRVPAFAIALGGLLVTGVLGFALDARDLRFSFGAHARQFRMLVGRRARQLAAVVGEVVADVEHEHHDVRRARAQHCGQRALASHTSVAHVVTEKPQGRTGRQRRFLRLFADQDQIRLPEKIPA